MISYEPLFQTMQKKGITSYRLFKMGFPQSNYYAMKRGENISTHTVDELCKLLKCNVADIMTFIDDQDV
ncbi:MAG: helix-turn-helix transcriptional regulator [Clostridiales bacterium]|nr:helix-turn-helix transcriptional regulator [Clostridiales bacterium]MCI6435932.1 helix-turn-helix transcriptional regulator [Clostridiales bacterium]